MGTRPRDRGAVRRSVAGRPLAVSQVAAIASEIEAVLVRPRAVMRPHVFQPTETAANVRANWHDPGREIGNRHPNPLR